MDMQKDIKVIEESGRGRYVLAMPDGQEAHLRFQRDREGDLAIDYSFVPPASRGRGVAAMLVLRAVQDARESGSRIVPLCGYVAAEFRRHKEWRDVLKI